MSRFLWFTVYIDDVNMPVLSSRCSGYVTENANMQCVCDVLPQQSAERFGVEDHSSR